MGGLRFFFPFLKTFLKLGMQTAAAVYFGALGLALGSGVGNVAQTSYSWKMCAVSGGLAGAALGSLLAQAYFKPLGVKSDTLVWVKSVSSSITLAFLSLPAAGFAALFLTLVRSNHSIPSALIQGFKLAMKNFHLLETPSGLILAGTVFLSGLGFRALLDALDGRE